MSSFDLPAPAAADLLPLSLWQPPRDLLGVFTDIDDTLTTDGAITADALDALQALRDAGLAVIPVTGRPAGWSEPFALSWPVHAIVAENGAVAMVPADGPGTPVLRKLYQQDAATRAVQYARMQQVLERIEGEVPGARRATDSAGRECDIAIDHSEFTHLPQAAIDAVVQRMRAEGMHATVSSIHINGWYGDHDKLAGARWIVRELFGRPLDEEIGRWVYVGDSTNDQKMFEAFHHSVGVANVARFVPQLVHRPRYVTRAERGAGFAEVARAILQPGRSPA
ncbi:HAD-IIB family hydrolase [Acidovorax sp. NCPPB 3859]|nr:MULTISPECIES: HAD-IIB family hydrolase [unclassified Acidovorax]MDA8448174.1 HAD-IIB family hydrolase [Acidovorax sp. GBBC 3297]MDA8457859.1 HAD-IIB family hydrolase [Acidovorax sp. GBBC 3333]MDA8462617.1 HAD-IIB family hydrolase [Acidovorax sp. GBBC 3332]MDA8467929.1 HAD-IIB family hydrolase [Acidovorax sp. GBBC 3299]WCM77941.1 HAD-IIB family hydrolase [Acidovorax sp. GBBC 712]